MIRRDVSIELGDIRAADARAAIDAHARSLTGIGDSFMGRLWLNATHRCVLVDGEPVGMLGWAPDGRILSLLTLDRGALALDRQVMEYALGQTGARVSYVASWDAHHVALFGAFASTVGSQAYQFRVVDARDLREPLPGLALEIAMSGDLDYLESTGWDQDFAEYIEQGAMSVARLDGEEVGIAVHEENVLDSSVVDIGFFVDAAVRRRGIGSSMLALTARHVLDEGRTPVAGCWWKNWSSRVAIERAGLVCSGTILRFDLDPETFVADRLT